MSIKRIWIWVGMLVAISGCGVTKELCRYTREQLEYHEIMEDCLTRGRVYKLAVASWEEFQLTWAEFDFTCDFADGFIEGFVDYVVEGPGAPPIIPPRYYWTVGHETPLGHERAQEWLRGFRAGVVTAERSGYRSWATVPVVLPYEYVTGHGEHVTEQSGQ